MTVSLLFFCSLSKKKGTNCTFFKGSPPSISTHDSPFYPSQFMTIIQTLHRRAHWNEFTLWMNLIPMAISMEGVPRVIFNSPLSLSLSAPRNFYRVLPERRGADEETDNRGALSLFPPHSTLDDPVPQELAALNRPSRCAAHCQPR